MPNKPGTPNPRIPTKTRSAPVTVKTFFVILRTSIVAPVNFPTSNANSDLEVLSSTEGAMNRMASSASKTPSFSAGPLMNDAFCKCRFRRWAFCLWTALGAGRQHSRFFGTRRSHPTLVWHLQRARYEKDDHSVASNAFPPEYAVEITIGRGMGRDHGGKMKPT